MMKNLAIIAVAMTVAAFAGFVGAWLLFQRTAPDVHRDQVSTVTQRPPARPVRTVGDATNPPTPGVVVPLTLADVENAPDVFEQLYLAWQLAAESDATALEQIIDQCLDVPDPLFHDNLVAIMLERYVALDPEAAMNFVTSRRKIDQAGMQGHVLTSWVRYDPEAAIAYFSNIRDLSLKQSIGARLMSDPTLASTGLMPDVEAAIGPNAERIRERIDMNRADPAVLFESALNLNGHERDQRLNFAVTKWIAQDADAALSRILLLPAVDRHRTLEAAIIRLSIQDPERALEFLQQHNLPQSEHLQGTVLAQMVKRGDLDMLPQLEDFVRRTGNEQPLQNAITAWAYRDPTTAINYVDTLPEEQRKRLYPLVSHVYIQNNPVEGLNWLLSLGPEHAGVMASAEHLINAANVGVAERALPGIQSAAARDAILSGIARQKAAEDIDSALAWLSAYRNDPGYNNALTGMILNATRSSPDVAARIVSENIDTINAEQILQNVALNLHRLDATKAQDWLLSLPSSPERDHATLTLASMAFHENRERALDMFDSIASGPTKDRAAQTLANAWVSQEPGDVEQAIERLGLTEQQAEQLRELGSRAYVPVRY